jgi:16S rRNA (cytidine1402-2'-O)-methyltransferase
MSKLYIVPTPIGNLEDMTFRAIRILKEVDLILAEDTRTSGTIKAFRNWHTHVQPSHAQRTQNCRESHFEIKAGENIALISDAGTPAISDPVFIDSCLR